MTDSGDRIAQMEKTLTAVAARLDDVNRTIEGIGQAVKGAKRDEKGTTREFKALLGRLAKLSPVFDASVDPRFAAIAEPLASSRRTMLGYDRLFSLWQAAGNVASLNLPAVEVGTFRGGSAALLAQAFVAFSGSPRDLHVVDTFEGHLDSTFSAHDPEVQRGKFRETTYEDVREFLGQFPGVSVHKGDIATVAAGWPERSYSLVHLDVDLYQPILWGLEYFGPRTAPGGVIVVDDYEAQTCPGVAVAVHEFLGRAPVFQAWRLQAEQVVLIKRG